jgi:hypothetical protein
MALVNGIRTAILQSRTTHRRLKSSKDSWMGLPLRAVSKDLVPPVSPMALQRYKTKCNHTDTEKSRANFPYLIERSRAKKAACTALL